MSWGLVPVPIPRTAHFPEGSACLCLALHHPLSLHSGLILWGKNISNKIVWIKITKLLIFKQSEVQVYLQPFWKYSFSFSVARARRKERKKTALRSRSNSVLSRKVKRTNSWESIMQNESGICWIICAFLFASPQIFMSPASYRNDAKLLRV